MLTCGWLLAFALTGLAWATTGEGGDPEVPPPEEAPDGVATSPEEELEAAIVQYLSGELETARLSMIRLANDPRVEDSDLGQRVRLYLGEVQYVMGEQQAAWSTFLAVLLEDPTFRMDPFVHPPDVIAYFESVREYAERFQARPPPPPPPPDPEVPGNPNLFLIGVPGGLQFFNEQNVLGYVAIAGIAGSSTAALSLRVHILDQDISDDDGVQVATEDERIRLERLRVWRNVCLGTTGGVWGLSVVQGLVRAYRPQPVDDAGASLTVGPAGAAVTLRW